MIVLQDAFDTENGAGLPARTSLDVNLFEPMPDTEGSRDIIAERVEGGRAIAAADDGLVELVVDGSSASVVTTSDPLEAAVTPSPASAAP